MRATIDSLLDDIVLPEFNTDFDILKPPLQVEPLKYTGFGDKLPEEFDFETDILRFEPTAPTMVLEPVRDLITGEIISYRDCPVATVANDDSSLNRPISNIDDYHRGSSTGIAFTPGGVAEKSTIDTTKISQYMLSLETGTDLLATPLSQETVTVSTENLPQLPDQPGIRPSNAPRARAQEITDQTKIYAVIDDWDISNFPKEVPNPAITFPFQLDPFQLRSIRRLEMGQSVFVSAPTSAGKTVVAQYAIALCREHKMRCLYTSPIKALSNQKFRDLSRQFGDVGILTGDVSINREASCLIMTTEILRSMLYHGADILRDVECVVFDECHYISNDERGVVWEESIILLPFHINMVFLSATVPNSMEIADWIGRTKQRMVYVQNHFARPVPLEHCLYTGISRFYRVSYPGCKVDQLQYLDARISAAGLGTHVSYSSSYWSDFINTAQQAMLMPMLIFCFSQRMCEDLADTIKNICLLTKEEQHHVRGFTSLALSRLSKDDRQLPQIVKIVELLQQGIGVHHGGVLPIIKEIVEILLADGYIKILFCTSTFAMGINVPARSCAFISTKKFNGRDFAPLTPTEYVQMSGRAGRRGLDTVGTSILICWGEVPELPYLTSLFHGKVEALESQFKLKFNMILNLLRVKDIGMVDLLRRSLSANLVQSMMPQLVKKLQDTKIQLKNLPPVDCVIQDIEDVSNFGDHIAEMKNIVQWMFDQVDMRSLLKQLTKGRVVYVLNERPTHIVIREVVNEEKICGVTPYGEKVFFSPLQVALIFAKPTKSQERMGDEDCRKFLQNFNEKPIPWTKILATSDFEFAQAAGDLMKEYEQAIASPCNRCALMQNHLSIFDTEQRLLDERDDCERQMHDESLAFKPLLDAHIDMCREMGYINNENVLLLKGRVAIEITSVHEILGTELLFSHIFDDLTPEECACVCSIISSEGVHAYDEMGLLPPHIPEVLDEIEQIAIMLDQTLSHYGIPTSDDFVEKNVNPILAQVVFDWAQGRSFRQVMDITEVAEGTVVRVINRVSEALRDFSNASKLIGSMSLSEKFDKAAEMVKRDIIFASSLYFE